MSAKADRAAKAKRRRMLHLGRVAAAAAARMAQLGYEHLSRERLLEELRKLEPLRKRAQEIARRAVELSTFDEEIRVQAEQIVTTQRALEDSRDRYADLFDFAPLGYAILSGNGVVREVNLMGAAMLGVERDTPLIGHVASQDRRTFLEHMRRRRRGENPVVSDLRLVRRDGREILVQMLSRPSVPGHDGDKAAGTYRTVIIDMTERLRAQTERQRLEAEKQQAVVEQEIAQASSKAKDHFLAVLSHELRTPLTPVVVAAAALLEDPALTPQVRETLEMIRRNADLEAADR
jgi:PAS domain S-box-containing protein